MFGRSFLDDVFPDFLSEIHPAWGLPMDDDYFDVMVGHPYEPDFRHD